MASRIQEDIESVLAFYSDARTGEQFGSSNDLWSVFGDVKEALSSSSSLRRRPNLRVAWSAGQGSWAKIPWVAFLDERETNTTQRGVYCVYLFRQDMSGAYLAFHQGVTDPVNQYGKPKAHQLLRERADTLRAFCGGLEGLSFRLDGEIDLRADQGLGIDYQSSTIAHKLYESGQVPDDETLLHDLEDVLSTYDRYLTATKWDEAIALCVPLLEDRQQFDEQETEYKLKLAKAIQDTLDMESNAEDFAQGLRKAFAHSNNNLTNWQSHDRFTRWALENPEQVQDAVRVLMDEGETLEERIDGFLDKTPEEAIRGLGTRISIASFLLMGTDSRSYPFYKPTPFDKVERVLGWPSTLKDETPGNVYAHHRRFAKQFLKELQQHELDARDLLDAQSLIWTLAADKTPALAIWREESSEISEILDFITSWIGNLKTQASTDGHFHYKPLLLLAALDVLDAKPELDNSLGYEELREAFMRLVAERGSSATEDQFSQPYLRMRNDAKPLAVWSVRRATQPTADLDDAKADQPTYVRTVAPAARIHPFAWPAFKTQEGRERIWQEIHARWFADEPSDHAPRYWRVLVNYPSLSEEWQNWQVMRDGGFVGIGWEALGDLSRIAKERDLEGLRSLMKRHYNAPGRWTHEIYKFVATTNSGDVVLAAEGKKILGVGKVTGDYFYEPSSPLSHRREVEWFSTRTWELPRQEEISGHPAVREIKEAENLAAIETLMLGPEPPSGPTLDSLASELMVEKAFLEEVIELLHDKGQVIFYGPPGTGKTYVARKLMQFLAPKTNHQEIVQFHPSYSYEDFVHGYRPVTRSDGSLAYELKPGPLMRLAQQAKTTPGEHVLLIDEINRGNLPKILGELLYLLEYRDDEVALMYGEDETPFSLPDDLLIIGTMNTADRSIALIDAALRRRFHFVPFFPSEWPLEGLLRRWLERYRPEMVEVADLVDRLNAGLRERFGPHLQVGPSYFMKKDLDEAMLRRVWEYNVMPFLEDQLFGQEEELEKFKLEQLQEPIDADLNAEGISADPGAPEQE